MVVVGRLNSCRLASIGIPIIKIRQSHDRLILNMKIPIRGKDVLYVRKGTKSEPHSHSETNISIAGV